MSILVLEIVSPSTGSKLFLESLLIKLVVSFRFSFYILIPLPLPSTILKGSAWEGIQSNIDPSRYIQIYLARANLFLGDRHLEKEIVALLLFDEGYYLIDRSRGFFVFEHVSTCKCEQFQMFRQLTYHLMAKQCLLELRPDMVSSREFTEFSQFVKRHSFF